MMLEILIVVFFVIAVLYSSAGFGGGSSYIALLAIFTIPYQCIPSIALLCNIIVSSNGSFHLIRAGYLSLNLLLPFVVTSIPMAFLGGSIAIDKTVLLVLLSFSLLLISFRMIFIKDQKKYIELEINKKKLWFGGLIIGAILGFLSGLIGIGGGVFLAPVLYNLKWGKPKQIASTTSLFILINSISGLVGHLNKLDNIHFLMDYLFVFIAVLIGGQIGGFLCSKKFSQVVVKRATAILLFIASLRILLKVTLFI